MSTGAWIILIIVIVLVALAVGLYVMRRSSQSAQRTKAQGLRDEAAKHAAVVEQQEAKARETAARAQEAQAAADVKAAEADQLQSVAQQQQSVSAEGRSEVDEQMQRADQIDPDVGTKSTADMDRETASGNDETALQADPYPQTPTESGTEERRTE
jgi:FtsZ-interacting cell division protein ZipA